MAADELHRRGLRRLPRGHGGLAAAGGDDPHDLPDQPRDQRQGDAQEGLDSLTHALRVGEGIGAIGVVVHPGALKDDTRANAKKRAIKLIKEALARTESCPIFYENTAGSPQLLGRDFDETAELIEKTGGPKRLGLCIDTCHLHATGYDVRTPEGVSELADEIDAKIGLKQLKALHLNDSRDARGSNRDRHAAIGKGEIGRKGFRAFLGEPRLPGRARRPRGPGARRPRRRPQGRAARPTAAPGGDQGSGLMLLDRRAPRRHRLGRNRSRISPVEAPQREVRWHAP